ENIVWSLNHQVAPKAQALTCGSCHGPNGALDWKALGYDESRIKSLSKPR
ncbi:MAG: cytochrome C, partial [Deltaproteobacteria bacterium]|nr:cytochrome C [Deltaproteobacteria bacterium]